MTIKSESGAEILVHVGINTVNPGHRAFKHLVKIGERVEKDRLITEADLDMIKAAGLSTMIIVVALNR